jgi:phosphate transport system substrate-binding protein
LVLLVLAGILALSMVAVGCGKELSGSVSVGGSTTVQPLAQALADAFQTTHSGVGITIAGGGTSAGIKGANEGTFDIGAASRDLKSGEPALITHLLAKDGIGIITSKSNKVIGLTKAQVVSIFKGTVTNWQDVGGPNHNINVFVRESGSGTRTAFQELVMGSENITSSALQQTSSGAIKQAVAGDSYAIGFESLAYVDSSIKALDIDGVAATQENAKDGTYPVIRPLYFLTKEQPTALVKDFIDFCQSKEGQQVVEDNGYIPVN